MQCRPPRVSMDDRFGVNESCASAEGCSLATISSRRPPAPASLVVELCKMTSPNYLIEINAIAVIGG